jgi:class 3 adenylate cyclase
MRQTADPAPPRALAEELQLPATTPSGIARAAENRRQSQAMGGPTVTSAETSPSLAAIVSSVDPALTAFRGRTSPDGMMTIVFTDIVGSTAMIERLGEERWLELMHEHNRIVRECVMRHDGEVVKSQGDGFMTVFASSAAALSFSIELQRTLAHHNERYPNEQLPVRIGVHTGNIYAADEDFLGKNVVLAARITGRARGGEILVSAESRGYTEGVRRWTYGRTAELRLKGLAAVHRVHSLDWLAAGV